MRKRIGKDIKNVRRELGLRQVDLAAILITKPANVSAYEAGRAMPPTETYLKIMDLGRQFADLAVRRKELLDTRIFNPELDVQEN